MVSGSDSLVVRMFAKQSSASLFELHILHFKHSRSLRSLIFDRFRTFIINLNRCAGFLPDVFRLNLASLCPQK